jgi:hypothetical protein
MIIAFLYGNTGALPDSINPVVCEPDEEDRVPSGKRGREIGNGRDASRLVKKSIVAM